MVLLHFQCNKHVAEVECEPPDVILELQRKIALLETQLADCQKKCSPIETYFPSYEALSSFYKYIEPKLSKMQYLVKVSQPYQDDKNRHKPGPSRSFLIWTSFYVCLRD